MIHLKYLIKASHRIEIKCKIEQPRAKKNITQVIYRVVLMQEHLLHDHRILTCMIYLEGI